MRHIKILSEVSRRLKDVLEDINLEDHELDVVIELLKKDIKIKKLESRLGIVSVG